MSATRSGATLPAGQSVTHELGNGRKAYVVPASGRLTVNGTELQARDGAAIHDEDAITLTALEDTEVLLADLP